MILLNLSTDLTIEWAEEKKSIWKIIFNFNFENPPLSFNYEEVKEYAKEKFNFLMKEIEFINSHNEIHSDEEFLVFLGEPSLFSFIMMDFIKKKVLE